MDSSSLHSLNTNQASVRGYSTPPRSKSTYEHSSTNLSFSELFHQSKLLSSAELRRRFSPIKSSVKKRRHYLIKKNDSIVPLKRDLNMPVILEKLYDNKEDLSIESMETNENLVPISASDFSLISSNLIHSESFIDCLTLKSFKTDQSNLFSISESTMKQKLKTLLQKT